jgi:hypothetical protein
VQQLIYRQCVGALLLASGGLFAPLSGVGCQKQKEKGNVPDSTFTRGIAAHPGGTLVVNLGTGGFLVVRGWDRDFVSVRAHLSGPDWHDTKLHLDRVPNGVRLRTNLGGSPIEKSTSHEFEIWAPRNYSIDLQSAGGGIDIQNLDGNFRGQTAGGSIELTNVRGVANLSTRGGHVVISDSHLEGSVTTRGGAVKLTRVTGGVRAAVERESVDEKKTTVPTLIREPPVVAGNDRRAEAFAASFNKSKHEVKEKQGVRTDTYLDVRSVPVIKRNPADYSGAYDVPELGYNLRLRVDESGRVEGAGYDALDEGIGGTKTFKLRAGRIAGALITATTVYANGLSEPFEGVFMNQTMMRGPLDKGVTAFGLGVVGRRFRIDTLNVNRVFYRLKP